MGVEHEIMFSYHVIKKGFLTVLNGQRISGILPHPLQQTGRKSSVDELHHLHDYAVHLLDLRAGRDASSGSDDRIARYASRIIMSLEHLRRSQRVTITELLRPLVVTPIEELERWANMRLESGGQMEAFIQDAGLDLLLLDDEGKKAVLSLVHCCCAAQPLILSAGPRT
jgi:hypothetical protein